MADDGRRIAFSCTAWQFVLKWRCRKSFFLQRKKRYVYGLAGIARLFGCSLPTANRIKQNGKINRAITQISRKISVDADLVLELAGRKTGGRG